MQPSLDRVQLDVWGEARGGGDNEGPAMCVLSPDADEVPAEAAAAEELRESGLENAGHGLPEAVADVEDSCSQISVRDDEVTAAQPGGQRLGVGADQHHPVFAVQGGDGWERWRAVPELAVVVVLDEHRTSLGGPGEHRQTCRDRQPATERVLVAGGEERRGERSWILAERVGVHSSTPYGDRYRNGSEARHDPPGRDVSGVLGRDTSTVGTFGA